jgi:Flp pilus assembly protein TadD
MADLARLGAAALIVAPAPALAQGFAQPVVQPLPDPAAMRLSEALRTLGRDPRSVPALIEAGRASIGLDDVEAAAGFFARAAAIAPSDGAVKAGLATVATRQGRPIEALALFAEAEAAGEPMRVHAAERGLAYDLVGDNAQAQQQYSVSLSVAPDPAIVRRLAMSQAIAGDQRASEATLLPLLQRRDLAAYRTRAFALAVLDKTDEAVAIAETMLPERVSSRLAPYLRYMPRLTRAQQAAAANLGVFPRAAEIGRDDPAIAAFAGVQAPAPLQQAAGSRLVPSGAPLGDRSAGEGGVPRRPDPVAVTPPTAPSVVPAPEAPPPAEPADAPEPQPVDGGPVPVTVAALPDEAGGTAPRPSISLDEPEPEPESESQLAVAEAEVDLSLAEAFADFDLTGADAGPAEGAVDITRIEPPREIPRPAAPPPPPPHPSRQWVQVATGRDVGALEFDWRRIRRNAGGLLDRYEPHVAAWGQTNRLVAGPFASAREAQDFVSKLKEKQIDSFRFTSAQGEEVRPLE